jgi:hypothetical protein
MNPDGSFSRGKYRTTASWRRPLSQVVVATAVVFLVVMLSACATSERDSANSWRGNYFKNPDSVWGAIELSLIELDYEVTEKNRPDGVIRAESSPANDGTVIILSIDQVMRTADDVSVFVKPSFGGEGGDANPDLLKAAADGFMKILNAKLYG